MRRLAGSAIAALLLASPLAAQDHPWAVGLYGGYVYNTAWNASPELVNGQRAPDLVSEGWILGTTVERYFAEGRLGARFHAGYAENLLEEDTGRWAIWDNNVYYADVGLLLRLLDPGHGRLLAPYVGAGLGVVASNPAGVQDGMPLRRSAAVHPGNVQARIAGVPSVGVDIHIHESYGFRLEFADHIAFQSPLRRPDVAPGVAGERHGPVHHTRFTASLLHTIGSGLVPPPPELPVAPAPPPPPAPPPAAEPEEVWVPITVCVIDTRAPRGLVEQEAVFRPETGDTLAVVNGRRVALGTVAPTAPVVADQSWYVEGRPLEVVAEADTLEFLPFGTPRHVDSGGLVFLGTVEELPAYASMAEATPALEARPGDTLARRLERDDAATVFERVQTLYLPAAPIGCSFVPANRMQRVGKDPA